jgi:hypothetical protein
MSSQDLMYSVAGGLVTGQIGNRSVHFNLHPTHNQLGLPKPGDYRIYPPVND